MATPKVPKESCQDSNFHCWHFTGTVFSILPSTYQQVCCWCGLKRTVMTDPGYDPREHGRYLPKV